MTAWILAAAAFGLMLWATHEEETRAQRWYKILPSVVAVWLMVKAAPNGTAGAFAAFGLGAIVAAVWSPVLSHHLSGWLLGQLHQFSTDTGGFRVDLTEARVWIEKGAYRRAIRCVKEELRKDARNYEALLLLATLHRELKEPAPAAAALDGILGNPAATDEQKRFARLGQDELRKEFGPLT